MKEVNRYESGVHYCSGDAMVQEDDGYYVKYSDYAELKAERDALSVECAALKQVFATKEFSSEVTDVFSDTAVLRIDGDEYHSWQWADNDSEVIRAVLEVMKPETPATAAYLNSVRAEGVEMVKAHPAISLCSLTHVCEEIAAQLRAGKDGE